MFKQVNLENKHQIQKFIKINHKNYSSYLDEEALINLKVSLYTTLASIQEEIIGPEIEKIFQEFIPDPNTDILKTMITKCQNIYNSKYKNDSFKFFEDLRNSLENIINKNYNMEFYFFNNSIEELAKILIYSYLELSDYSFDRNICKTKYKINTYKDFIKAIDNLLIKNIDVIKRYQDKNIEAKLSVSSHSTRSSFSSVNPMFMNNNSTQRLFNSTSFSYFEKVSNTTPSKRGSKNSTDSAALNYTQNIQALNSNEFELPIEFIILLNKFQTIKRLKLFVPSKINDITSFILVLSNIEWLFPNLFEIELDLSMGNLHGEFYDSYYTTYRKEKSYGFRKYSRDLVRTRSNCVNYLDMIKENRQHLELLVIYSYYISKLDKIKILFLNFPESLQMELNETLKLSDVNIQNLHLLSFFNNISNLYQLNLDFNCLDYITFQKIISIILKNNHMKSLKMNIFSGEEYGNYSSNGLFKLSSIFNFNLKSSVSRNDRDYLYFDSFAAETDILNKLVRNFEENMEKLFYVLQLKHNLNELHIKADLPRIISNCDKYVLIFHKFLVDIFSILNNKDEVSSIQSLKIIIPYLPFDNRKFPKISKYLNTVNLNHSRKFSKLTNLTIHLRFNKVQNLSNIISFKLKFLQIGDLDVETFSDLAKHFSNDEFKRNSQLTYLNISLSNIINDYTSVKSELDAFLSSDKPQNLKEIYFNSSLILNEEEIKRIYKFINYDSVERYSFTFSKKCNEIFLNVNSNNLNISIIDSENLITRNKSESSETPQLFYRLENKKINAIMIKLIYKLYSKKSFLIANKNSEPFYKKFLFNSKLCKNVRNYLLKYEKKEIQIVFK